MQKILLPFIFYLFIGTANAQIQVTIKSLVDSSILPYATVLDVANNKLRSVDINGSCIISAEDKHIYRITYIGFNTTEFALKVSSNNQIIYLSPKKEMLKEVILPPCVLTKVYKKNNQQKKDGSNFGGIACVNREKLPDNNAKFSVHLSNDKSWSKLHALSFWLVGRSFWPQTPKNAFQSQLILSFYSIDKTTKMPAELLYNKPIFINPINDGKQTIELDNMDIILPKEGIFICFEFIIDTTYQWKTFNKDTVYVHQGVNIDGAYAESYGFVFFNNKTNSWFRSNSFDIMNPIKLRGNLKLEAVYKICKD